MTLQANLVAAAALGALGLLSSTAAAQTGPGTGPGGGMGPPRTLAETSAWADRLFARLDANQDEAITGDELAALSRGPGGAMGGGRMRRMIGQADASNDGRISREELTAGLERMFTRMDVNGDGVLSDEERPRPPSPQPSPAIPMPPPEPMQIPEMPGGAR